MTESILDDIPFELARLSAHFRRFSDRTLKEFHLKPQPIGMGSILYSLLEQDNCRVQTLVDQTQLPNGTVSYMLDQLENDGIINRIVDPEDGRARLIRLTAKGRRLHLKMFRRHERAMQFFQSVLSHEEMCTFHVIVTRLIEAFQKDGAAESAQKLAKVSRRAGSKTAP